MFLWYWKTFLYSLKRFSKAKCKKYIGKLEGKNRFTFARIMRKNILPVGFYPESALGPTRQLNREKAYLKRSDNQPMSYRTFPTDACRNPITVRVG